MEVKIAYLVIPEDLQPDAQIELDFLYRKPGEERFSFYPDRNRTLSQDEAYLQESAGQLMEMPEPFASMEINPEELAPFVLSSRIWLLDPRTEVSLQGGLFIGKIAR